MGAWKGHRFKGFLEKRGVFYRGVDSALDSSAKLPEL